MATEVAEKTEKTVRLLCDCCLETYVVEEDWILDILESAEHVDCPSPEGPGHLVRRIRRNVRLDLIDDNPYQPRQTYDDEYIIGLADSIEQIGLLQTPLARFTELDRFQLAFGHQRVLACIYLKANREGPEEIEIDVGALTDEDMAVIALTENVARKQLTSLEVIRAHRKAIDETALTVTQLAEQLGRDQSTISNNLRILELPDFVLQHVESGDLAPSVAREFLCLQGCENPHIAEMRSIIGWITGMDGPPDFRRKTVRAHISSHVARNETDFRPIGKGAGIAGAARNASFGRKAFIADHPKQLHNVPAGDTNSRMWTCAVKDWTRAQTAATRAANKAAAAEGNIPQEMAAGADPNAAALEKLLASDPVWKDIKAERKTTKRGMIQTPKPSPNRPVTDEEKAALGTRAEMKVIAHGDGFFKILDQAEPQAYHELNRMRGMRGGLVPPWFDLEECRTCTIGATYARSRHDYPLERPTLVCLNEEHYTEKLKAAEAEYRAKLDAQRETDKRRDLEMIDTVTMALHQMPEYAKRPLATALVQATENLKTVGPFRFREELFTHDTAAAEVVGDLIELSNNHDRSVASVDDVAAHDLSRLIATLTVHHLRIAGKVDVGTQLPIPEAAYEVAGAP